MNRIKSIKTVIFIGVMSILIILPLNGAFAKAKTIPVAQIGPLSGGIAFVGVQALNAMKLAAEEINAAGSTSQSGGNPSGGRGLTLANMGTLINLQRWSRNRTDVFRTPRPYTTESKKFTVEESSAYRVGQVISPMS